MSDSTAQLRQVVGSFVSAEESLRRLEAKRAELAAAAERFLDADDSMRSTTEEAVRSLDDTKHLLDLQVTALSSVTAHTDDILASMAQLITDLNDAVAQLQRIDADRFMADLAELRRDMTDGNLEIREARRAATGAQESAVGVSARVDSLAAHTKRAHETVDETHAATKKTHEAVEKAHEAAELAAQAIATRVDAISTSLAKSRALLFVIIAVGVLSLVLSFVSVVRG